ncbi:MAG: nitrous oxide-stimulated promoter family protein [Deferribacterales bacterium]
MKKDRRVKKDAKVLNAFIHTYCRENHGVAPGTLCPECAEVLAYALARNIRCPLDPKPKCKDCKVHCYKPEMRDKIRRIMKFSGIYYIKRGRLDWVFHYFI